MKTFWLLEKLLHEEEFYVRMRSALESRGIAYSEVDYMPTDGKREIALAIKNNADKLVVPYGCIQFIDWFTKNTGTTVGKIDVPLVENACFFNLKQLSFERYSSHWGKYLLNQDCVITTYAELIRKKDFFFKILGEDNTIFVRPVSNDKVFTGRRLYYELFDKDVHNMGCSIAQGFEPHMMVVVAAPKNVSKEWRFAVVNKKLITSSLYNVNGLHEEKNGCDNPKAIELAEQIVNDPWQPDDIYALDICETKSGEVACLEIGSLNSAGWYQMDCGKIIDAFEEWKIGYEKNVQFDLGEHEGQYCNSDGCSGIMEFPAPINCSCHLGHPPCSACTNVKLTCPKCGREV